MLLWLGNRRMILRQRRSASLLWLGPCSSLAAFAAATLALVHEARQLSPSTVSSLSLASSSVSWNLSSTSTASETTTMSPTSTSSEQSSSSSSSAPASPATTYVPLQSSGTSSHSSSESKASPTPSPSETTSAAAQASSSPAGPVFTVHNMTTCTSNFISWAYNGTPADLLLSISNIGVDQNNVQSSIKARQTFGGTIQQQLADTSTSESPWSWSSVNVTQGWYEIKGTVVSTPSVSSNSARFFIANGTDVTCLTGASLTVSSSTSISSPSATSSPSASNLNTAAVAGGVVGGVVGVLLLVIAGVCLWSRKRKRGYVGSRGHKSQKWGSLKSADSNIIEPPENGTQLTGRHAHSESTAGVLRDVAHGSTITTPGDTDEDAAIMGEEKLVSPASSSGMNFDVVKTPVHDRRISASDSIQIPSSLASESPRSRFDSAHTSGETIEQQTQRIRSSMEVSMRRRSERLSIPTLPSPTLARLSHSPTYAQHKEEYPLSPVAATPVNRSVSASAVSVTRRASRKPVPLYDPSVLLEDTNTDAVSVGTACADSSHSHGTGNGAGVSGMQMDLVHKASFGDGRPMHYLIPDMPPPQQD